VTAIVWGLVLALLIIVDAFANDGDDS